MYTFNRPTEAVKAMNAAFLKSVVVMNFAGSLNYFGGRSIALTTI